jgi:hypothetical protein
LISLVENKNVLMAFSDPAGAKSLMAFANLYRHQAKSFTLVSDRSYDFADMFHANIQTYLDHSTTGWLDIVRPDVLITGTSSPEKIELAMIQEASKRNIPTASFIDHWFNFAIRFQTLSGSKVYPDKIFVLDERARQLAISEQLPEDKIAICENPYYTFLKQWKPAFGRDLLMKRLQLAPTDKFVLYAPEPLSVFGLDKKYGFNELDGLKDLQQCIPASIKIVVKLHPNQKPEIFDSFRNTENVIFSAHENINHLMYYADAVIGFFSNSIIEANLLGKLVIRPLFRLRSDINDPLQHIDITHFLTITNINDYTHTINNYIL